MIICNHIYIYEYEYVLCVTVYVYVNMYTHMQLLYLIHIVQHGGQVRAPQRAERRVGAPVGGRRPPNERNELGESVGNVSSIVTISTNSN